MNDFGLYAVHCQTPFANDGQSEGISCQTRNSQHAGTVACASLEGSVGVIDVDCERLVTQWKPHGHAVTDVGFSLADPSLLFTSSRDGSIGVCDCRLSPTERLVAQMRLSLEHGDAELWSLALGGAGEHYLACSVENIIRLYDVRALSTCSHNAEIRNGSCRKPSRASGLVWTFDSSHSDVINVVRFHPIRRELLVSGADDDLVVIHDTNRCAKNNSNGATLNDDDTDDPAIIGGLNNASPPRFLCFAGSALDTLCVVSTIESLCAWHCSQLGVLENASSQPPLHAAGHHRDADDDGGFPVCPIALPTTSLRHAPELDNHGSCGYIVNLVYDDPTKRLYAIGGSAGGRLVLYHVNVDNCDVVAHFNSERGHSGIVRCADVLPTTVTGTVVATGGEDGLFAVWRQAPVRPEE